jgi:putative peptidoglycan lipid II flippase
VLNIITLGLIVCTVIGLVLSNPIAHWLMANRSLEQQVGTAQLMRIMLLSVICFGISNVFSGILQAKRQFIAFALAPILYNVGIIIGIIWLYPKFGVVGLAYGVILGALLHLTIQGVAVFSTGFHYQPWASWRTPGVKKLLRLMPPRALALGITQVNAIIITAYALRLSVGNLTIWKWADNLQNVPINMFGVSLAISAFPIFSQAFAEQDLPKFKQVFSNNFRRLLFLIIPISVVILLLRAQIVRLILGLGSGAFDWTATIATAQVLGIFSIALFAQASIPLLARSFFAHQDTKTTVVISIISVLTNLLLANSLSQWYGLYGLALAFSISSVLNMLLLLGALRLKFGDLEDNAIIQAVLRISLATISTGFVIHGLKYLVAPLVDMQTYVGILIQTLVSMVGGAIIYMGLAYIFQFPELNIVKQSLIKLKRLL